MSKSLLINEIYFKKNTPQRWICKNHPYAYLRHKYWILISEELGIFASLTSFIAILGLLATGKYDHGILIADSKKEAADLVGFTVLLSLIVLTISFITLQVFSSQVAGWFSEPLLSKWLWIPPLNAFVIIIFNSFNEWCVRH